MRTTTALAVSLLFTTSAAAAAAPSSSASEADFLASLSGAPAGFAEAGVPEPQSLACNVSVDCGDGNTVACTGNGSCQTTIAGVKCDGTETQCPNFCTIGQTCQCCNGTYNGFCWSRRGDCQYTSNGIACNGHEITCETSCPFCQEW